MPVRITIIQGTDEEVQESIDTGIICKVTDSTIKQIEDILMIKNDTSPHKVL